MKKERLNLSFYWSRGQESNLQPPDYEDNLRFERKSLLLLPYYPISITVDKSVEVRCSTIKATSALNHLYLLLPFLPFLL